MNLRPPSKISRRDSDDFKTKAKGRRRPNEEDILVIDDENDDLISDNSDFTKKEA